MAAVVDVVAGSPSSRAGVSKAEWVARMSLLAESNRELYRMLREIAWEFVVENSSRSDFPSNFS